MGITAAKGWNKKGQEVVETETMLFVFEKEDSADGVCNATMLSDVPLVHTLFLHQL